MRQIQLFTFILLTSSLFSQTVVFNATMSDGVKAVAELRFKDLDGILKLERRTNPANRVPDHMEAAALTIRMFFVEDENYFKENEERFAALIARVEQLPDTEPYKRVLLAEMLLGRAGVYGKFKNNVKAAWSFYKAYNLLEENLKLYPRFIPTLIPYGVLQTAVGSLPSDYKSIASLFGFQGNIEQGLKDIRKAYYHSLAEPKLDHHKDYFGFVYAFVNFELETDEQVSLHLLGIDVRSSSLFSYLEAQQKLRVGESQMALALLEERPRGSSYLEVPFFDYYTGKVALMVEPEKAKKFFNDFLSHSKDLEHRKSAYRYLAWYHLLKGQKKEAERYRQKILVESETLTGSDKQALAEAKRGFNLYLITARLDFDAGRYAKMIQELNLNDAALYCKLDWEWQEYYYRRGRALQELGLIDQAIPSFMKSLEYKELETYSLASSTLQLALMFESKGNLAQSRKYFKAALALESYPFHEGVQQKAKAGLERLP
jgi:tetratricopeptide (TPR) repeat protein